MANGAIRSRRLNPVPSEERTQLEIEIVHLRNLDLDGLRLHWRTDLGRTAPNHLPKHLLFRLIAYRLQAQALGDVSRATTLFLEGLAKSSASNEAGGSVAIPGQDRLKPGTVLVREHEGEQHHVMVTDSGFVWNGTTFPSLTKIAFAITGTRWNGPRFFGLRDRPQGGPP
jgi:hypothetical protein